jgi:hypothetical protein
MPKLRIQLKFCAGKKMQYIFDTNNIIEYDNGLIIGKYKTQTSAMVE